MESPYIGKARYKSNSIADEKIVLSKEQSIRFSNFINRLQTDQFQENEVISNAIKTAFYNIGMLFFYITSFFTSFFYKFYEFITKFYLKYRKLIKG